GGRRLARFESRSVSERDSLSVEKSRARGYRTVFEFERPNSVQSSYNSRERATARVNERVPFPRRQSRPDPMRLPDLRGGRVVRSEHPGSLLRSSPIGPPESSGLGAKAEAAHPFAVAMPRLRLATRAARREARTPRGRRSFGLAHTAEQRVHVGPEPFPLLSFLNREPGKGVLAADAAEAGIGLPLPQALVELSVGRRLAPPGKVLAEPLEGLPAPAGASLAVQLVGALALSATRPGGGAGGEVAVVRRCVLG